MLAPSWSNDSYLFRDAIAEAETLPEAIQEKIGRELHAYIEKTLLSAERRRARHPIARRRSGKDPRHWRGDRARSRAGTEAVACRFFGRRKPKSTATTISLRSGHCRTTASPAR